MIRITASAIALATAVISICGTANAIEKKTKPVPVDPLHQWTGFYVGGNIGYGIAGLTDNGPLAVTTNMTGVVGGVQAGYNYQYQHLVVGVEADVQASNQQTSYTRTLPIVGDFTVSQKIPYFMTARGRLGFAFQCGCVMAYGTAGIGYGAYEPYPPRCSDSPSAVITKGRLSSPAPVSNGWCGATGAPNSKRYTATPATSAAPSKCPS
jgi:outer membrane immunogenic protein